MRIAKRNLFVPDTTTTLQSAMLTAGVIVSALLYVSTLTACGDDVPVKRHTSGPITADKRNQLHMGACHACAGNHLCYCWWEDTGGEFPECVEVGYGSRSNYCVVPL